MKQTSAHFNLGLVLFLTVFAGQALSQKPQQVEGAGWTAHSNYGPAVATDGNYAYIAWVDSSTNDIFFATFTGDGFGSQQTVGGTTSDGGTWTAQSSATPAWGYDGLTFYLIWKGNSSNDIWFSAYSDGVWGQQQTVGGTDPHWTAETSVAPAASFYNWPLTLYWKGASSSKVWTSSLNYLQPGWTNQQVVSGFSTGTYAAPAPEQAPNSTGGSAMFLTNPSNDIVVGANSYAVSGTGPTWTAQSMYAPAASANLADPVNQDVVFWKGLNTTSIWYSYNTGTPLGYGGPPVWSVQQTVTGAATDAAPTVAQADGPSIEVAILAWKNASDDTIWYIEPSGLKP